MQQHEPGGSFPFLGGRPGDTEGLEQFGVLDREFYHLLNLLDLLIGLIQATDHLVCAVGHLFDHHERYKRVDFVRKDFVKCVGV